MPGPEPTFPNPRLKNPILHVLNTILAMIPGDFVDFTASEDGVLFAKSASGNARIIVVVNDKKLATRGCRFLGKIANPEDWPGIEVWACDAWDSNGNHYYLLRTLSAIIEVPERYEDREKTVPVYIFVETPENAIPDALKSALQ